VRGTQLNDTLTGTFGTQTLFGNGGDDRFVILDGRFGDNIDGGTGIDTLDLSPTVFAPASVDLAAGTYTIVSAFWPTWTITGVETVIGTALNDTITGDFGNNSFTGGEGDDLLDGSGGIDTVLGGGGNDTLYGGFSTDSVNGGAGNDVILVREGEFGDAVDGAGGKDTLDLSLVTTRSATVDLLGGTWDFSPSFGGPNAISGIEVVIGTQVADTIAGGNAVDELYGRNGDDALGGNGGNDKIYGESGNDTLSGGAGNDLLDGSSGLDLIFGNDGNDTIFGGFSTDTVDGGAGNDTFRVRDGEFGDNTTGGAGVDTLDLGGVTSFGANVRLDLGTYDFIPAFGGPYTINTVENVIGTKLADTIIGSSAANTLSGDVGNDSLDGGGGSDVVSGGAGADTVVGGGGNDALNGNDGIDKLNGGGGNDTIAGGRGNDQITTGAGTDVILFDTTLGATNIDKVSDFAHAIDEFQLAASIFTALAPGALGAAAFRSLVTGGAIDASDRILYYSDVGALVYDSDGSGAAAGVQFATLTAGLFVDQTDFLII
jgi:serralysin